jgi:glycosyltransferase involved in cell wall biosynthesis
MFSSHRPLIHLWTPGLFEFKGGIQVYSNFLLAALQSVCPHASYQVFSLHDRRVPSNLKPPANLQFYCTGVIPKRLRTAAFAARITGAGLWQRPDLLITTHLNFTPAAHRLKQLAGIPYWTIAHGFEAWKIQRPALRNAVSDADRILAVSEYTRDRLIQTQSISPDQISLLHNTFDANQFSIAPKPFYLLERHYLTPEQPIILTVNRLAAGESYHPYDRVLDALPLIRRYIPQVHYLIVGEGNDRSRLEQEIQHRQLQDCVTLAGFVPDVELKDYYNLCDVFAMPSKLEGFGIVFLEALASGKPVLASNQDGGQDAIKQGELGALVNPDDTEAIAQTLIQILQGRYTNPLLFQPEALRQKAIQTFGTQKFQQTLAQLLYENSPCHSIGFTSAGWSQSSRTGNGAGFAIARDQR